MKFNSFAFLVFFPVVAVLHFLLPHRFRWVLLLVASCAFYMWWKAAYILVIGATASVDYFAGLMLERTADPGRRKLCLSLSLASNLGILFVFKYYDFFVDSATAALSAFGLQSAAPAIHLLLPIGISFHTFQGMSYAIEVYRGNVKAERHAGIFALFVMFFPQLVAGPIERPAHLLPQMRTEKRFDATRAARGLQLMLWGLFKKVCVADRLAPIVDQVYADPGAHSRGAAVIATVFFAFQIYCDFSGYSDIAVGAADVLGFDLMQNFRRPYGSKSVPEFWKRWHVSLSTWFRDYLYIPLGGNRVSRPRLYLNVMIVFLVSGLWHGANWTFLVWGGLHGLYFAGWSLTEGVRARFAAATGLARLHAVRAAIGVAVTFVLVTLAWTFFRATSMTEALAVLGRMFSAHGGGTRIDSQVLVLCAVPLAILVLVEVAQSRMCLRDRIAALPVALRWSVFYGAILLTLFLGVFEEREFIYFRF